MEGRARLLPAIVTAALVLAFGAAALTVSAQNLNPGGNAAGAAATERASEYRAQVESIRTRLVAGERVSLVVRLKLDYRDARGQPVPIAELERTKAEAIARLAGPGIESARSLPNATALQVIVTSGAGLDRILSDPMVREVWEDKKLKLLVNQSRQIVHATMPWNDKGNGTEYTGQGFAIAIIDTGVAALPGLTVQAEACFSTSVPANLDTLCPSFASTPPGTLNDPGAAAPCTGLGDCDHGTHVAGIAVGATVQPGIAPKATVVAIQAFSNDQGELSAQTSDIISALAYVANYNNNKPATANKIVSVNMSLGTPGSSVSCADGGIGAEIVALKIQGVTVVAASGNDGKATLIYWPACVNIPPNTGANTTPTDAGVVSVGATNKWDVVATFSNAGPSGGIYNLDLLAPGAGITAVVPSGGTGIKSGTSMAAPHVAGCVALLAEQAAADPAAAIPATSYPSDVFQAAMKATGLAITDWRDYGITTPRLDCGAALWNRRGANHLATVSGRKTDDSGQALPGWLIEAFSVGEPWPVGYVGHPSYSAVTDINGAYKIPLPWGVFQLGESPYGLIPALPVPSTGADYWTQVSPPTPPAINVNPLALPGSMGPFPGNDFVNKKAAFCPAGQQYMVLVANQKDHFAMPLDQAQPDANLQTFFADRYGPHPPLRMEMDENNWSNRAFIHTFDLGAAGVPANAVVAKAQFDLGARPVVQPPTEANGTYLDQSKRLERNDAVWLIFPDPNGGILGNPTAWGRGIGAGSILGPGLLTTDWDYPTQQIRRDFKFPLPGLPLPPPGSGLPTYVDSDIRPMIDLHRRVGLFVQDDTGVDYAAMHICTRKPGVAIAKTPTAQQLNTGDTTTFGLTVTNLGATAIPSSGNALQVADELPAGFDLIPNSSGVYTNWGPGWSCAATVSGPGDSKFVCTYTGPPLAPNASTTIKVPVKAAIAGTHQNCVSVDVIDQSNGNILDHNSACSVNSVGYDIGARKRKSEFMIRWDNPATPGIDPGASATFTLGVRNFGNELNLAQGAIKLDDTITHNGFQFIPGTLVPGAAWNCPAPSSLGITCNYTGAGLSQPGLVPAGFNPMPLGLERGFALPTLTVDVRGNETGWWQNCAKATLTGYTDEIVADDTWCVNVFVQGNIAVKKSTGHTNNEYAYDFASGQSELIDLAIAVSNLAGKIDAPLQVEIVDQFPLGFYLDAPAGFASLNPDWNCGPLSATSTNITCTYANLPIAGAQGSPVVPVPLTPIKLNLRASKPGIYQNCAAADIKAGPTPVDDQPDAISPPDPPPPIDTDFDRSNNQDCTIIIVGHDVRMVKSASNSTPNAGEPFTFDFQFTNHLSSVGPNAQLVFTDVLPSGFGIGTLPSGGVGAWNCSSSGPTVTCIFQTGATAYPASVLPPLSLPVVAPNNAGSYQNCADLGVQLPNNDGDDVPQNNTHRCATIAVLAHLSVVKVSNQTQYNLGDPIHFTVTVTNPAAGAPGYGSVIAAPVTINLADALPAGLTFASAVWPWTACSSASLTCAPPGPINQNVQFNIVINAVASTPGHYTNCFIVTLAGATNIPTSGNSPCTSFYVGHDVAIAKSVDNATPQFNATVTFTLPVANNLGSIAAPPANAIVVTDTLPSGLMPDMNLVTINNPSWSCTWNQPILTCIYKLAAAAGSALPAITVPAKVIAWGVLNNCASVALVGVTDDVPTNNGNNVTVCASVKALEGYLAIYKVYDDQTGGTTLGPPYSTAGFPINLSCSSFAGPITVPIKGGFFSSNDPTLTANPPSGFASMTGVNPSTMPSVPSTICSVAEAPLPSIPSVKACHTGSASWVTSLSPPGGAVTIVAGQRAEVTVTNTLKCDTGYLAIYKKFVDNTGGTTLGPPYSTSGFPIGLSCPGDFVGTLPVPIKGGSFSSNDPVLTANPPAGFTSMTGAIPSTMPSPAGITCIVNENGGNPLPPILTPACANAGAPGPATWTTTFSPPSTATTGKATIPVNGTAGVTVTNTLDCAPSGSLTVNKVVTGQYSSLWSPMPMFPIKVTCTDPLGNVTPHNLSVQGNTSSAPIQSLVPTSSCQIQETPLPPPPAPPAGCTWQPVVYAPATVPIASGNNTATVTNHYTCVLGSWQATKQVANPPGTWPSSSTFILHANCTYNGNSVFMGSSPPITAGTSWGSGSLPNGTSCVITEPTLPGPFVNAAGQTCNWHQQAPLSQTIITNPGLAAITVTNYFTCP
jgi:uncharacterized repeat protein (TIGR01451 family)